MSDELHVGRLFGAVAVVDLVLAGLFALGLSQFPDAMPLLVPGQVGMGLDAAFTGNYVFAAFVLLVTALLILAGGLSALAPVVTGLRPLRGEVADQRDYLRGAGWLSLLGALLLIAAFAGLCFTVAQADATGTALFVRGSEAFANSDVTPYSVTVFTLDQLAGALLFDIPEIYGLKFAAFQSNPAAGLLLLGVALFRVLIGLTAVALVLARLRGRGLRLNESAAATLDADSDVEVPWTFSSEGRDIPRDLSRDIVPATAIEDDIPEMPKAVVPPPQPPAPPRAPAMKPSAPQPAQQTLAKEQDVAVPSGLEPVEPPAMIKPLALDPLPDFDTTVRAVPANDETIELEESEQIDARPPRRDATAGKGEWKDHHDAMLAAIRGRPRD